MLLTAILCICHSTEGNWKWLRMRNRDREKSEEQNAKTFVRAIDVTDRFIRSANHWLVCIMHFHFWFHVNWAFLLCSALRASRAISFFLSFILLWIKTESERASNQSHIINKEAFSVVFASCRIAYEMTFSLAHHSRFPGIQCRACAPPRSSFYETINTFSGKELAEWVMDSILTRF